MPICKIANSDLEYYRLLFDKHSQKRREPDGPGVLLRFFEWRSIPSILGLISFIIFVQVTQSNGQSTAESPPDSISEADRYFAQGEALFTGTATTSQLKEAFNLYLKAAELGNAAAQHRVGVAYATGRGVQKNESEAVWWYQKSVDGGFAEAQCDLGVRYLHGQGVNKDERTGLALVRKAAGQGYEEAIGILKARGLSIVDSENPPSTYGYSSPTNSPTMPQEAPQSEDNRNDQPMPPAQGGTDEEKSAERWRIAEILALKLMSRPGKRESVASSTLKTYGSIWADKLIGIEINKAFNDRAPAFREGLTVVVEKLLDAHPSLSTIEEEAGKRQIHEWLKQQSSEAADDFDVLDFLYQVYKRLPSE
jgi:Sel1 repeat-containing protein